MSLNISSWGKARLRGASSMCQILLGEINKTTDRLKKENQDTTEVENIASIVENWNKKISQKLGTVESEITKSMIDSPL